jgi:transposase-like protein
MARDTPHPPALKADVVAALVAGGKLADVCREFGVPKSTVERWKIEHVGASRPLHERTREAVGALILDTIIDSLQALRVQAGTLGDPDWIKNQSAAELAALRQVEWDRLLRLLAGFRSEDSNPPELGPGEDLPQ